MNAQYNLLSNESKIAYLFYDSVSMNILHSLWSGVYKKDEIYENVKSNVKGKPNIDKIIDNMVDIGIIYDDGGLLYMIQDVEIFKTLPLLSIASSESLFSKEIVDKYKEHVMVVLTDEKINVSYIAELLSDNIIYSIIELLRKTPMRVSEISSLIGEDESKVIDSIKKMSKSDTVMISTVDGKEWVFLLCDIRARTFFPDHFIRMYEMNKSEDGDILRHIEILIENFPR